MFSQANLCREEWELVGNSSSTRAQLHHYYYWAACGNQVLSTVYFEKRQNGGLITKGLFTWRWGTPGR